MHRRKFFRFGALTALAAAFPAFTRKALAAWPAAFKEKQLSAAIAAYFGKGEYEASGDVFFKTPEIAENGAVVPVTVRYKGGAKKIAVFVEANPQPLAVAFSLSEKSVADVSTRIKMGESSIVHAVVQTADGKLLGAAADVKVTIGGCGG